ncbi:DUF7317 family protein [Haloplanus natans]|nr:hypothetical protein [Haloplanus natans]
MSNKSFQSSVILYRSGTLTLSQAARHAGCSDAALAAAVGSSRDGMETAD